MNNNKNRKKEIINACIRLINEKGLDLSSMQDIANKVGISKSTLYFYFDSKESLYREVFLHCHRMDCQACNEGIDELDHALDKLCKRFENIINYAISHPQEAQVEALYQVSPVYGKESELIKSDFIRDIVGIMEEGIEKKQIKNMSEWILAEFYYGIAYSMYMKFKNEPELWDDEFIRKSCFEMIKDTFSYKK